MSVFFRQTSLAILVFIIISCGTKKKVVDPSDLEGMEHVELDEMVITPDDAGEPASLYPYREVRERKWDLIHTALDISFDWTQQQVLGKAKLKLKPLYYPQSVIELDAINFTIHALLVNGRTHSNYSATPTQLIINLPRAYNKTEEITIDVDYTATPKPGDLEAGEAITNDQGLFFIDPMDTIPGLSRQLWTQGETSSNRRWYPTLDQPNERGTQEITLTVPDSMITLSNGVLVSSTPAGNGMRKDYWKLDLPHAPYLAMVAVGQWDKVTDYWRGRPVEYYVHLGYGDDARAIFAHTTQMLDFFSEKLDFPYVWPKYSQIIVENFVTGAMENTTAVTFGDFIQFKKEDVLAEGANDYIVAHEMFHHWFGDLVTCESWSHIALNEGFANYAEYLWSEHKYGKEKADISRMSELSGYLDQAERQAHPLIDYHYADEVSIFDAHSYNKGGLVLHMLRDLVGDDAFFASLKLYLDKHKFSAVEVHDLRQAFEEVTGKDLSWFFDQWYFGVGHPVLQVEHEYDPMAHKLTIDVKQTQSDQGFYSTFRMPLKFAIFHHDTSMQRETVWLEQKEQSFVFDLPKAPVSVVLDPDDVLLAVVDHTIDPSEYAIRALKLKSISHRLAALRLMTDMDTTVVEQLMSDTSMLMRAMVIEYFDEQQDAVRLYQMALKETNIELQYYLLEVLPPLDPKKAKLAAIQFLKKADKIPLIYAALKAIAAEDTEEAVRQLTLLKDADAASIYALRASIYAKHGNGLTLDYFTSPAAAAIDENYLEELINAMAVYLSKQPVDVQQQGLSIIDSDFFLKTDFNTYRRFYLITGLLPQYQAETDAAFKAKLLQTIRSLYAKETDDYLRSMLKEGLGDLLD